MTDVWFHVEKTIAKSIELGPEAFGRLIQDISEAVLGSSTVAAPLEAPNIEQTRLRKSNRRKYGG
jgi:hypothetical protein